MKLSLWEPEWIKHGIEKPDCFVCQREGKRKKDDAIFCPLMNAWLSEELVELIYCNACVREEG